MFGMVISGCNRNEDVWHVSGFKPDGDFITPTVNSLHKSNETVPNLDGYSNEESESIEETIQAEPYRGKKVILKGEIKTEGVSMGAGFFMSVEGTYDVLAYDDLSYSELGTSNDWKEYKIILYVPEESNKIVYGLKLRGKGDVWAKNVELYEADNEAELTGLEKPFISDQWIIAGSSPENYEFEYDLVNQSINSIGSLDEDAFCTLMKYSRAKELENKELELSADIRNDDIKGWAGLWMRIDGYRYEGKRRYDSIAAFDNMNQRKIVGTNDWTRYEVNLKVPGEYKGIGYGILLAGNGKLEVKNFKLRIKRN